MHQNSAHHMRSQSRSFVASTVASALERMGLLNRNLGRFVQHQERAAVRPKSFPKFAPSSSGCQPSLNRVITHSVPSLGATGAAHGGPLGVNHLSTVPKYVFALGRIAKPGTGIAPIARRPDRADWEKLIAANRALIKTGTRSARPVNRCLRGHWLTKHGIGP
jgi:hypothetical protein